MFTDFGNLSEIHFSLPQIANYIPFDEDLDYPAKLEKLNSSQLDNSVSKILVNSVLCYVLIVIVFSDAWETEANIMH